MVDSEPARDKPPTAGNAARPKGSDRLIVHIGMHKTGSSSIQETLAALNPREGFQYLRPGGHNNGSRAIAAAYGRIKQEKPEPGRSPRRGMIWLTSALNNLEKHRTGILSAEAISTVPSGSLPHFIDLLGRYRPELRLIGYVREPIGLLESAIQQRLKACFAPFGDLIRAVGYRKKFLKFDEAVGEENVELRLFARHALRQGCVVQDFCARIGLPIEPERVVRVNTGLCLDAVKLLYLYRSRVTLLAPGDAAIIEALQSLPGERFRLHSSLTQGVVNERDIAWISARLGTDIGQGRSADDDGAVASESDLRRPSAATLEWLAGRLDWPASRLQDEDSIIDAVQMLGRKERAGAVVD